MLNELDDRHAAAERLLSAAEDRLATVMAAATDLLEHRDVCQRALEEAQTNYGRAAEVLNVEAACLRTLLQQPAVWRVVTADLPRLADEYEAIRKAAA